MNHSDPQGLNAHALIVKGKRTVRKLLGRNTDTDTNAPTESAPDTPDTTPGGSSVKNTDTDADRATVALAAGGDGGESLTDFEKGVLRAIRDYSLDPHEIADPASISDELSRKYGHEIPLDALTVALNDLYDQGAIDVSTPAQGAALSNTDELWSQRAWPLGDELIVTRWGCDLLHQSLARDARQMGLETRVPKHAPPGALRADGSGDGEGGDR